MRYQTQTVYASILAQKENYAHFYISGVFSHIADCITQLFSYDTLDLTIAEYQTRYMLNYDSPKYVEKVYNTALSYLASIASSQNSLQAMTSVYDLYEWLNEEIRYTELTIGMSITRSTISDNKKLKALLRVRFILSTMEWYKDDTACSIVHMPVLNSITRQDIGLQVCKAVYGVYKEYNTVGIHPVLYALSQYAECEEMVRCIELATKENNAFMFLYAVNTIASLVASLEKEVQDIKDALTIKYDNTYAFMDMTYLDIKAEKAKNLKDLLSDLLAIEIVLA